jgi:hypothetical protein
VATPYYVREVVPCPGCGAVEDRFRPVWTWWGGFIGPWLLRRVLRCGRCGTYFREDTGARSRAPLMARLVPLGLVIVVLAALAILG